jgi:hypothetical protein
MALAGRQISIASALAACRAAGWAKEDLIVAVAVMSAESLRYVKAYHVNDPGSAQESTDRGLFQINDMSHPDLSDEDAYSAAPNVKYAQRMYRTQDFKPWAAFNSGAYAKFLDEVRVVFDRGLWRTRVALWKARMA